MTETIAIRTESLNKTFGRREKAVEAVKDLDLRVESGQDYGFLGPIGAGLLLIALGLWVVVPVALSIILFSRQDITS